MVYCLMLEELCTVITNIATLYFSSLYSMRAISCHSVSQETLDL